MDIFLHKKLKEPILKYHTVISHLKREGLVPDYSRIVYIHTGAHLSRLNHPPPQPSAYSSSSAAVPEPPPDST
jgi:hypothetical protein